VVLVRLHEVEVATLALREAVLAVELQLGDLDGVLARALSLSHNSGVSSTFRKNVEDPASNRAS
jgi:hypothetical protein